MSTLMKLPFPLKELFVMAQKHNGFSQYLPEVGFPTTFLQWETAKSEHKAQEI